MMRIGDDELWRLVQGGDAEAFGELFERHAPFIHRCCFRRTGDWARAEDLTSITFLEAWRRRDVSVGPDKVLPWLVGIASNVLRNERRALRRYAAALARIPDRTVELDFADDVGERVRCEEETRALLAALRSLPRREHEALALVVWEGLSHADAAFALGVAEQTVRSRLFRARRRLRKHAAGRDASSPVERTAE
jgi:RNA polymerase sigma-70 factor (ECF subfamily)